MRMRSLILLVLLSVAVPQSFAGDKGKNDTTPGVIPPQARFAGLTYTEWGVAWWQWVNTTVVSENPMFDLTGAQAANNQEGHVWFLAGLNGLWGTWADRIPVTREIQVPSGTALFFPILNNCTNNVETPDLTVEEMIAFNAGGVADIAVDTLFCTIDGKSVKDLGSYRAATTADQAYAIWLPDGDPSQIGQMLPVADDNRNIEQYWGFDAAGWDADVNVCDGYWVMVAPLSVGKHTIHFGGRWGPDRADSFYMDVTYNITVVPAGKAK